MFLQFHAIPVCSGDGPMFVAVTAHDALDEAVLVDLTVVVLVVVDLTLELLLVVDLAVDVVDKAVLVVLAVVDVVQVLAVLTPTQTPYPTQRFAQEDPTAGFHE